MAHVIPTLRTESRTEYIPPAMRRKSDIPVSTGKSDTATDFGTVLKDTSKSTATAAATAAAATATAPATVTKGVTASPSGTIGTVTPWSPSPVVTPAAATTTPMAPTAQSLFGSNPWSTTAGGTGPNGSYSYNSYYFATPQTAAKVADMLGGKVVAADAITPYGPFQQSEPNQMVQMPDGRLINAGLVAGFYDHGYTQQTVDKMIAAEVSGDGMYS
jgi:hypothetical protein